MPNGHDTENLQKLMNKDELFFEKLDNMFKDADEGQAIKIDGVFIAANKLSLRGFTDWLKENKYFIGKL